ncbi:hypothetical protein CI102_833 [Trichoderma harzianum]|nr:hypothetical protein CI102_833 [Trichoderma harzianum]
MDVVSRRTKLPRSGRLSRPLLLNFRALPRYYCQNERGSKPYLDGQLIFTNALFTFSLLGEARRRHPLFLLPLSDSALILRREQMERRGRGGVAEKRAA